MLGDLRTLNKYKHRSRAIPIWETDISPSQALALAALARVQDRVS